MRLTLVGTGDAFGTGGRFNTCFHVAAAAGNFLIDCGATSLVALRQQNIDVGALDAIFISHLHGDHFAGLPNLLMHAFFVDKREKQLILAGPRGLRERLVATLEVLYPGCAMILDKLDVAFAEYDMGKAAQVAGVSVTAYEVDHPSGAPSCGLRLAVDGKIIAFSGDTAWTEALIKVAREADLFLCECYTFDRDAGVHLSYQRIMANLDRLGAKKTILTHMGGEMLAKLDQVDLTRIGLAQDGMVVQV